MFDSVGDISFSVLVGEIEEVNGACCVEDVNSDIADLSEAVGSFVQSHEFGDHSCGLCA